MLHLRRKAAACRTTHAGPSCRVGYRKAKERVHWGDVIAAPLKSRLGWNKRPVESPVTLWPAWRATGMFVTLDG